MTRLLEILVAIIIVCVLAVVFAVFLPAHRHIERSVEVSSPARQIFDVVDGFHTFPSWNALRAYDPRVQLNFDGPVQGPGAKVNWTSEDKRIGAGSYTVSSNPAPQQDSQVTWDVANPWRGENKHFTVNIVPVDQRQDLAHHDGLRRRFRMGSLRPLHRHVSRRQPGHANPVSARRAADHARDVPERRLLAAADRSEGCREASDHLHLDHGQAHARRRRRRHRQGHAGAAGAGQEEQAQRHRRAHHDHHQLRRRELRFRHGPAGRQRRRPRCRIRSRSARSAAPRN